MTVLARHDSKSEFPSNARVVRVDYGSLTELTSALKGQDAVVSTLSPSAMDSQLKLLDATIAAGVKRYIPSDFGSDFSNPKAATLPIYHGMEAVRKILEEKVKHHPEFSYTSVRNGVFLDWGLALGFQLDLKSDKPAIYDGGDRPFSTSTLATVGKSVVGVLNHPEETKNRAVYVHDMVLTQHQVLASARRVAPERKWEPVEASTVDAEAQARENFAKGLTDIMSCVGFFFRSVLAEGYGGEFKNVDNELLGLGFKTDDDLDEMVKTVLAAEH